MDEKVDLEAHYRPFMDVVAKSPFDAIEEHAKLCYATVKNLEKMFDLYADGKFDESRALWQSVHDSEHEADKVKNTIRDKMLNGGEWRDSVPKSVADYIDEVDGVRRLKRLSGSDEPDQ